MKGSQEHAIEVRDPNGTSHAVDNGVHPDSSSAPLMHARGAPLKSVIDQLEMTIVVRQSDDEDNDDDDDSSGEKGAHGKVLASGGGEGGGWASYVERVETALGSWMARQKRCLVGLTRFLGLAAYLVYFVYCLTYRFGDEGSIVLVGMTSVLLLWLTCKLLTARSLKSARLGCCQQLGSRLVCSARSKVFMRYGLYVVALVALGAYLGFAVFPESPENAQSLLGIFGIMLFCFVCSYRPSKVNWHPVFWGFVIQFCFAFITLQTKAGYRAFMWLGDLVQRLLAYSDIGTAFVIDKNFKSLGLAFASCGLMIFFGALIGVFTHWGVIDFIVIKGGRALSSAMHTGPVESVIAVANIFIGMTQAPLLVRPYLPTMSRSEISAMMTCGFASVSGDILALFISFGAPANHLITAAIVSAPAALAIAKLLVPETEQVDLATQTAISSTRLTDKKEAKNSMSAAAEGGMIAAKMHMAAMVNMLAFVALLALIDAILQWFGERAGVHGFTFDAICGYVLFPLAFAMGAPFEDCQRIGSLIGIKLFATPVVGYTELGKIIHNRHILEEYMGNGNATWHWEGTDIILDATNTTLFHGIISERSEAITTYAMCGYSAFTAIGITLGALIPLCPVRKDDIISSVSLAFLGGNMASFATGAVAGLLHMSHGAETSFDT